MIAIKVLGSGCANCKATINLIETTAKSEHIPIALEKVEDMQSIISYGVLSTPGVVIGGKVVHAGGVPARDKIIGWLHDEPSSITSTTDSNCCS